MKNKRITLEEAVKFHGHLGPYLILGIRAGEAALRKCKSKKYFEINVKVRGAHKKPKSCLIDGLQLSTGATYGKGNIVKLNGKMIKVEFSRRGGNKKFSLGLKNNLAKKLDALKGHADAEAFARKLYNASYLDLFDI